MTLNIFKKIQGFRKNRKGFSLIEISVVILIIGVLIAGISQASDMIDDAALKGARTASIGSRVSRIKDLVLWLDATADGASLVSSTSTKQAVDGESVTVWKDSNPRSNAKLILTGTSSFASNKINNLPGITLSSGSSNFFKLSDRFDNSTGEYTIYLIYQPTAIPSTNVVILEKRAAAGTVFPYKLELESNGFYKLSDSNGSVSTKKKSSAGKINLIRLNRSSTGALTIIVDDVVATFTPGTISSVVNSSELIIGAQNAVPPTSYSNGRIGELIIYERDLVTSEESDIEAYLYKKWKIEKDSSKITPCLVTGVANQAVGATMAAGTTSFACLPGYTFAGAASCTAAPALVFSAGTATCTKTSCIATASDKIATGSIVPSGATCASAGITKCKDGTTTPTTCSCTAGTLVFNIVGCP